LLPPCFGPQVAEPERKRTALQGPHWINAAAIFEKETVAAIILADAEAVFERVKICLNEFGCRQIQIVGHGMHLGRSDIYGTRRSGATAPAPLALETKPVIEEIAHIAFVGVQDKKLLFPPPSMPRRRLSVNN
jgi:hypothetical protein